MNEHIYKKVDLVGTSNTSIDDAVNGALKKASQSLRNLRWFEITEIRGSVDQYKVGEWQVGIKLAFTLENDAEPETVIEKEIEETRTQGSSSSGSQVQSAHS